MQPPAFIPIAVLHTAVVALLNEQKPTAVLDDAVEHLNEYLPTAVLLLPVVLYCKDNKEFY
jgi:hypothetical protein